MPTERPLILDRYRPLGLLGSGASGSVEVAWDTRIQRRVAIKRIPLNGDPDMAAETLTEARTAALLNHPAIVQVFDFEIDGPEALIIMEHVDGETLADLLNRSEDPLELDVVAAIAQPVAEALSYAHENQVLHLDIKPENVLISHDGMVKVSDFGLASLSNSLGFSAAKGGTIGYMPPEQIAGKLVDERTDEWAFASMVYEMLTAKNPFFATGLKRAYRAACYANVTPPSLVRDDVSPTIDGILLDALSPSPEVRFGSIDALMGALSPCLGSAKRGHKKLAALVNEDTEDAAPDESYGTRPPRDLWNQLGETNGRWLAGAVTAAGSGWLAWLGLSATALVGWQLALVVAVIAGLGLAVPHLGLLLALVALGAGALLRGAWAAGSLIIALAFIWWLAAGRRNRGQVALVAVAPLMGLAHMGSALPLLAGFFRRPGQAVTATLAGGLLDCYLAVLCGSESLYFIGPAPQPLGASALALTRMVSAPRTWIVLAAWTLAALACAALCNRGTRAGALLGIAAGTGIIVFLQLCAQRVTAGGTWSLLQALPAVSILVSFILLGTIGILGSPPRADNG